MSKSQFIKLGGWTIIAGSFAFVTILSGSDQIAFPGSVISAILLAAGMWGLRAGYAEKVSRFSRNILLMGVIGMVLWYLALATLAFMFSSGIWPATQADGQRLWIVIFGGPAVVLLAVTLFGLAALRSKPMHHLNWLPVIAGIWYPAVYSFLFVYLISHNGILPDPYWPTVKFSLLIQFLALCIFGFVLVADAPQELTAA